jgi:antitoxin CptB
MMHTQADTSLPRLRWRCRRGMLELDVILHEYLDACDGQFDKTQMQLFEQLLDYPDQVLLDILLGNTPASDRALAIFVNQLIESRRTKCNVC